MAQDPRPIGEIATSIQHGGRELPIVDFFLCHLGVLLGIPIVQLAFERGFSFSSFFFLFFSPARVIMILPRREEDSFMEDRRAFFVDQIVFNKAFLSLGFLYANAEGFEVSLRGGDQSLSYP
jgi:hypothetical protein